MSRSNLHLSETVFPDGNVRSNAVLTIVEKDNHAIWVHGLANEEFKVLEAADNLLGVSSSLGLELFDFCLRGALLLELLLDLLHVSLEMAEILLLVERGLLETETVDSIDFCFDVFVDGFVITAFGRWVASYVEGFTTNPDLLAVGFIDYAINFLQIVGIGGDLVVGDDVLVDNHFV